MFRRNREPPQELAVGGELLDLTLLDYPSRPVAAGCGDVRFAVRFRIRIFKDHRFVADVEEDVARGRRHQIDREQQILVTHRQRLDPGKARALRQVDPIVKEKSDALGLEVAHDKTVRAVFSRRHIFSRVVFAVPGRRERVTPDGELVDIRLAKENAHQFSLRVVNAEANRPVERGRDKADPDVARHRGRRCRGRRGRGLLRGETTQEHRS